MEIKRYKKERKEEEKKKSKRSKLLSHENSITICIYKLQFAFINLITMTIRKEGQPESVIQL
jgi:hypothetical protein